MFNAYAWFIYATEVSTGVTAHVRSWKILFSADDVPIVDYIDIDVADIYPGMPDFLHELKAYNKSEANARVTFEILSVRILDEEYTTKEGRVHEKQEPQEGDLTSEELATKLKTEYPFIIDIRVSEEEIDAEYGEATYQIRVSWEYESGDDELDTEWGEKAYEFLENNPETPSISMRIRVIAEQV